MAPPCRHVHVQDIEIYRTCLSCGKHRLYEEWIQDEAADQRQVYIYPDLWCLEQDRTIRLIVLPPGEYDDPIRCSIVLSALQYSDYEAVSYTWTTEDGDEAKEYPIYIDEKVMMVTKNCHAALRRLRRPGSSRRLWVDAICINQLNSKERNHQVGLMKSIYREAFQVLVCIEDVACSYSRVLSWLAGGYKRLSEVEVEMAQLTRLFRCRYFSRIWVIQEVALAKVIVLYVNTDHATLTHDSLLFLRKICNGKRIRIPAPIAARLEQTADQSLIKRLNTSMNSLCSEPKDKIFAILSLVDPAVEALIPIDYTLDDQQVFANAVMACIVTGKSLDILMYARLDPNHDELAAACALTVEQFNEFIKSRISSYHRLVHPMPDLWTPHFDVGSANATNLGSEQRPISRISRPSSSLPGRQVLPHLTVRAYCIDICRGSTEFDPGTFASSSRHSETADILPADFMPPMSTKRAVRRVLGSLHRLLRRYPGKFERVFATERGVGFAVVEVQPEDLLCCLDGLEVMIILRSLANTTYRIVGMCVWESLDRKKCLDLSPRTIEIY